MDKVKKIAKAVVKSPLFYIFAAFLVTLVCYIASVEINAVTGPKYYKFQFEKMILAPLFLSALAITFFIMLGKKKISGENLFIFILLLGFILRLVYGINNQFNQRQHDVGDAYGTGHYGYTIYIFRYLRLPDTNASQFYQPPLNSFLQAIWMRIAAFFAPCSDSIKESYDALFTSTVAISPNQTDLLNYLNYLYNSTKILSIIYSSISLYCIYFILKEFNLKQWVKNTILLFIACQPLMVMMSGTMNNDNLSYMFFFISLLCFIRFIKKPTFRYCIYLALSLGLGMITKLSIGFAAFVYGPVMIYKFVRYCIDASKDKEKKNTLIFYSLQLVLFALIVFPLGLSYATRNYVKFGQSFTYILDFGPSSWLHENIKDRSLFERFFSLPFSQLIHSERGIYHDYREYNIWVDLIKTSIFDEFSYSMAPTYPAVILFIANILVCLASIASFIYLIVIFFMKRFKEDLWFSLLMASISLLGLVSYFSLCVKMPYSCTSNFRYITYVAFSSISLVGIASSNIDKNWSRYAFISLVGVFCTSSSLFILFI